MRAQRKGKYTRYVALHESLNVSQRSLPSRATARLVGKFVGWDQRSAGPPNRINGGPARSAGPAKSDKWWACATAGPTKSDKRWACAPLVPPNRIYGGPALRWSHPTIHGVRSVDESGSSDESVQRYIDVTPAELHPSRFLNSNHRSTDSPGTCRRSPDRGLPCVANIHDFSWPLLQD